jgi:predicted permease
MGSWRLFRKKASAHELDEELQFHIDKQIELNRSKGMSAEEARRQALVEFGGIPQTKEAVFQVHWSHAWETLLQDARYAVRILRKSPVFTSVAVLSLALGIGANTAIFSLIDSVLLNALPRVVKPEQLSWLKGSYSYPLYRDLREQSKSFDGGLFGQRGVSLSLESDGAASMIWGQAVTANYFDVLHVPPVMGRGFLPEEDAQPGAYPVVVLSNRFWRQQFGADQDILGKSIRLNGLGYTVIGVAPAGFNGMESKMPVDVWAPMGMLRDLAPRFAADTNEGDIFHQRHSSWMNVIGRLRPDVGIHQVEAELNLIRKQSEPQRAAERAGRPITLYPMRGTVDPRDRPAVIPIAALLLAVTMTVLLICCINLANLLLARGVHRHPEMGVRMALGASRSRLVRQLLVESTLLAGGGGLLGLGLSRLVASLPSHLAATAQAPLDLSLEVNGRVLLFTLVTSVATGILFGLIPALQVSRNDLLSSLKHEASSTSAPRSSFWRNAFIAGQAAFSLTLLIVAGLFTRSLAQASSLDPGFAVEDRLLVTVQLNQTQLPSSLTGASFYADLSHRIEQLPGVRSVSFVRCVPLGRSRNTTSFQLQPSQQENTSVSENNVGRGYFQTMGISILEGRDFTEQDGDNSVIVNRGFAQRYFHGEKAAGKRLWIGPKQSSEIVGVVSPTITNSMSDANEPLIYFPVYGDINWSFLTVVVHTEGGAQQLASAIEKETRAVSHALVVANAETMQHHISSYLALERLGTELLVAFGGLALVLAAIGVYGVLSYAVSQRTQEIGIRMALGADPRKVMMLVLGAGIRVVALGACAGLALSFVITRFLGSFLIGVKPTDPITFVTIPALLMATTFCASYWPARRATKVEPVVALRRE